MTKETGRANLAVEELLDTLHTAGIRSIPRAKAFLTLVDYEGRTLREAAGSNAGTPPYQRFMQDYLSLSTGYPSGSGNGAKLVRLRRGDHRKHNVIALTAKGKRLVDAIGYSP